jgi:hypothetical protein
MRRAEGGNQPAKTMPENIAKLSTFACKSTCMQCNVKPHYENVAFDKVFFLNHTAKSARTAMLMRSLDGYGAGVPGIGIIRVVPDGPGPVVTIEWSPQELPKMPACFRVPVEQRSPRVRISSAGNLRGCTQVNGMTERYIQS